MPADPRSAALWGAGSARPGDIKKLSLAINPPNPPPPPPHDTRAKTRPPPTARFGPKSWNSLRSSPGWLALDLIIGRKVTCRNWRKPQTCATNFWRNSTTPSKFGVGTAHVEILDPPFAAPEPSQKNRHLSPSHAQTRTTNRFFGFGPLKRAVLQGQNPRLVVSFRHAAISPAPRIQMIQKPRSKFEGWQCPTSR